MDSLYEEEQKLIKRLVNSNSKEEQEAIKRIIKRLNDEMKEQEEK